MASDLPTRRGRSSDPRTAYVRFSALFGAALQGFWVVTSVYLVVDVGLSPPQLLLLGTALEATILVAEIPTGVIADTISRKRSMMLSMAVMGAGFVLAGSSTSFVVLVMANVAWGVGWTLTSGADVAWLTDEMIERGSAQADVDRALTAAARWKQRGGAAGLVTFGLIGWLTEPAVAMMLAGGLLWGLGGWIAVTFTERGFRPTTVDRLAASIGILRSGFGLVRRVATVRRLLAVTVLFNLGAEAMDRLTERRLIDLGLPLDVSPVLFFTGLGIIGLLGGSVLLRVSERRIASADGPRLLYGSMSLVAALGAVLVAGAPAATVGAAGVFLSRGLAWSVLPVVSSVWINRTSGPDTRATVQSFLGQADSLGQISGGLLLGLTSALFGLTTAIATAAVLFALSGAMILARASQPENS